MTDATNRPGCDAVNSRPPDDVVRRFLGLLRYVMDSGRGYVLSRDNNVPPEPTAWGWHFNPRPAFPWPSPHYHWFRASGYHLGNLDGPSLYLHMSQAWPAVEMASRIAPPKMLATPGVVCKRLHEAGCLLGVDAVRGRLQVRRSFQGARCYVLWLRAECLPPSAMLVP